MGYFYLVSYPLWVLCHRRETGHIKWEQPTQQAHQSLNNGLLCKVSILQLIWGLSCVSYAASGNAANHWWCYLIKSNNKGPSVAQDYKWISGCNHDYKCSQITTLNMIFLISLLQLKKINITMYFKDNDFPFPSQLGHLRGWCLLLRWFL